MVYEFIPRMVRYFLPHFAIAFIIKINVIIGAIYEKNPFIYHGNRCNQILYQFWYSCIGIDLYDKLGNISFIETRIFWHFLCQAEKRVGYDYCY